MIEQESLDLSGNRISNEAAAVLMLALEQNASLVKLELGNNQLGDGICGPVAQMMLNNQVATYRYPHPNPQVRRQSGSWDWAVGVSTTKA